jgi:hypothetical protein
MLTSTRQMKMEVIGWQFPCETQGLITCVSVACAGVFECVLVYAKECVWYRVTSHVASTYGRLITTGANYTMGKLFHSPRQSDIRTPNQLNIIHIIPGRLI